MFMAAIIAKSKSHQEKKKKIKNQVERWTHLEAGPKHRASLQVGHGLEIWSSRHFIVKWKRRLGYHQHRSSSPNSTGLQPSWEACGL
jgi:hypothetical protein